MELKTLTIMQALNLIKAGKLTSLELCKQCLSEIEKTKDFNALHEVCKEQALKKAKQIDEDIKNGKAVGALAGIPIVLKDNINYVGTKTTCSSKVLETYESVYNATVAQKLEDAGAIIIGKANMDEFAMGGSTQTCAWGAVKNPRNPKCVPGGSSGGSAATVAANQCLGSLGTDTGGSIRQPSSYCGVVGMKPTYGLVSRRGIVAFASSLDQAGPITKTVRDNALVLDAIAGYDELEFTSEKVEKQTYSDFADLGSLKGVKVGLIKEFFELQSSKDVQQSFEMAVDSFKKAGAEVVELSFPRIKAALSVYYVLSSAEAASNLARFDGIKYGVQASDATDLNDLYVKTRSRNFGAEVKRRIMLGNFVLSSGYFDAYYTRAKAVQNLIIGEFADAFKKCDVIISPTTPKPAFKLGEKFESPVDMYLLDIFTVPVNIAMLPAISIPCGVSSDNLPLGLQIIGPRFSEKKLFEVANYFEKKCFAFEGGI